MLAGELHAFVLDYDQVFTFCSAVQRILKRGIKLKIFTDLKFLFDSLIPINVVTEEHLFIDLSELQKCCEEGNILEIL